MSGRSSSSFLAFARTYVYLQLRDDTSEKLRLILLPSKHVVSIIIVNDDEQDATILIQLFIPNQLYMFRAMFSPTVRST